MLDDCSGHGEAYEDLLEENAQDAVFSSPSMAAIVVLWRSANGRIEAMDAKGRTLKELQAQEAAE